MNKELKEMIRTAIKVAKRDGYSQLLFLANDNTYTIHRLHTGVKPYLWDMVKPIGVAVAMDVDEAEFYSMDNVGEKERATNILKGYNII